jgi:pimeloyl-ACP methyl ester carboxylesterase
MVRLLPFLAALVVTAPAGAGTFTKTDTTVTMSDGVTIAATFFEPTSAPPAGGWPAVMVFHGLGQSRNSTELNNISWNQVAGDLLAPNGYAVLTFDARAHGQSGGLFGLDGPREVQDTKELFAWLVAHPEIDAKHVGAFGVSYGGGNIWASTLAGVPFAAIAPAATWTDLRAALAPNGAGRAGIVLGFATSLDRSKVPSDVQTLLQDSYQGTNVEQIRAFLDARSSRTRLGEITVPTFVLQGRRDFAFDADQAIAAYRGVRGPKRLYLGDFGHAPAVNPPAELAHFELEVRRWFDHWLKNEPNGIETEPPVELAHDPWDGKTTSYPALPQTRALSFPLRGGALAATGKLVSATKALGPIETFGAPVVRVTATGSYPHLVAVLSALTPKGEVVVADGGADTTAFTTSARTLAIPLQNEITAVRRGSRLRVTLAATSTAQSKGNLVYLNQVPAGSSLTVRKVTLSLTTLRKPVSR